MYSYVSLQYFRQSQYYIYYIRAKVPQHERDCPRRYIEGMKKCGAQCTACPYILEGQDIDINGEQWKINRQITAIHTTLSMQLIV